jgi:nucleoside-diphosphate-sugar epimerase
MQSVSIVGCGYTGVRLAARCKESGASVRGSAASAESVSRILSAGAEGVRLDLDASIDPIEASDQLIFYMVPPVKAIDDARLHRFLAALAGRPRRLVYISTTGVYGDQGGATVDEDTLPAPMTERATRRLAAEGTLRAWADPRHVSWCVLRVPGIYGPQRLPLERLRRGAPAIVAQEATPGNRIHVDDLVSACLAAGVAAIADRRIYNVTDGSEDSLTQFLQRVARIAQLPQPPLITRAQAQRTLSESSWSFLAESRRVDNRRMREELGVVLAYGDLDAGICASLKGP